jgi:hypothetical protein
MSRVRRRRKHRQERMHRQSSRWPLMGFFRFWKKWGQGFAP